MRLRPVSEHVEVFFVTKLLAERSKFGVRVGVQGVDTREDGGAHILLRSWTTSTRYSQQDLVHTNERTRKWANELHASEKSPILGFLIGQQPSMTNVSMSGSDKWFH